MNLMKFQIFKGKNGLFYFRLTAPNGAVILASEGYVSLAGVRNGIAAVKNNALDFSKYERRTTKDGRYYFVLKAGNGEVIGVSELYSSEGGREFGISQVSGSTETEIQDGSSWDG